jgi:hypothetical protein
LGTMNAHFPVSPQNLQFSIPTTLSVAFFDIQYNGHTQGEESDFTKKKVPYTIILQHWLDVPWWWFWLSAYTSFMSWILSSFL